jgi:uncharacterized protein
MVAAMKSREEARLSTLRMAKSAFKNKEIEKRAPLTDAEAQSVVKTMIKQRHESIEMFTKGNRPELAAKEAAEIIVLEAYLPQAADDAAMTAAVEAAILEIGQAAGARPAAKDMGTVMKLAQAKIAESGARADGRGLSEIVKRELAK